MLCSTPTRSDNFLQVYSPRPEYHSLIYLLYCIFGYLKISVLMYFFTQTYFLCVVYLHTYEHLVTRDR